MYHMYFLFIIFPLSSAVTIRSLWDSSLSSITKIENNLNVQEDAYLNITQLTSKYGYPFEEHAVETEDGYILSLHRIPHGKNGVKNDLVVFLMHGILDSSDCWILQGSGLAFGYILADKGFDVWMGNARGNKHSSNHSRLNTTQSEFWEFSWEEIGLYDLPSMIDYVLNKTHKETLYYVGYSQGTTSFYVMTSMRPEYNGKIKLMFSLAPVAWMGHAKSEILRLFSSRNEFLEILLSNLNTYSPSTEFFNKISGVICSLLMKCDIFLYAIVGHDNKVNRDFVPVIFGHMPTGSSILQIMHYGQLVQSGKFRRYDYGGNRNLLKYGSSTPPDYPIENITTPIVLYYSGNDSFSDVKDVEILKDNLPNVYGDVYVEGFNHIDYVYAQEAKDVVYTKIISQIFKFENDFLKVGNP